MWITTWLVSFEAHKQYSRVYPILFANCNTSKHCCRRICSQTHNRYCYVQDTAREEGDHLSTNSPGAARVSRFPPVPPAAGGGGGCAGAARATGGRTHPRAAGEGRRAAEEGGLRHRSRVSPGQGGFPSCHAPCARQTATGTTGAAASPPREDGAARRGKAPAGGPGPGPGPAGPGVTGKDGRPGPDLLTLGAAAAAAPPASGTRRPRRRRSCRGSAGRSPLRRRRRQLRGPPEAEVAARPRRPVAAAGGQRWRSPGGAGRWSWSGPCSRPPSPATSCGRWSPSASSWGTRTPGPPAAPRPPPPPPPPS